MLNNDDLFIEDKPAFSKAPGAKCWDCPLCDRPCVQTYVGSNDIKLVIVGEAPGYYEVQQGVPFVGPSGQMLDYLLNEIEINQEEIVKTNAVLCRPENNETPSPQAIKACSERLQREIASYPAAQIVTLGRSPYSALRADYGKVDEGILKSRGQWYQTTTGREFLATLHPAFVLRQPQYFNTLKNDFIALSVDRSRDWLATTKYRRVDTQASFDLNRLPDGTKLAFDVETRGLDAHNDELICLAIAFNTYEAYIFTRHDVIACRLFLQRLFNRCALVAHNGKFDLHVLAQYGIEANLADDTMLAHYALDETKGTHGLKALASTYLGVQDYEAQLVDRHFRAQDREKRDYSTIPQEDLYQYVAIDACATLALNEALQPMLDEDNVRGAYNILISASNALQHTERKGIKIDRPYLELVLSKLLEAIENAKLAVKSDAAVAVANYRAKGLPWVNPDPSWIKSYDQYLKVLEKCLDVNLGSWQQMQVLLYDVLGLTHQKKVGFKTKPRSTNAEALDALSPLNHPFVKILQEFRRLDKIRSTYVEPLLHLADANDRVHINFLLHGTETGRLSASDSMHGIPRPDDIWGQAIRGAFIADKGKRLVIADYSQAELRCFAAESKEPFLLDAYNNDEDVHGNTCVAIFPDDPLIRSAVYDKATGEWIVDDKTYWKRRRVIAKNVNFGGLVYLGGASGIVAMIRAQTGMDITEAQVRPVLAALQARMPTGRAWQVDQFRKAKRDGFVQSRFGNKRRFPIITDDLVDEIRKAAVNAPIQNEASQLTLLSAIHLIARGYDVLHLVHDSLIVECDAATAEYTKEIVNDVMVGIGFTHFPEVKWKADVEISDRWYQNRPEF